ncbi:MAG: DNA-3-methyladenine glycosylase [Oligoflexales bacterium]
MYKTLDRDFFARPTLEVARELIGKYIVHQIDKRVTLTAKVVETEAYCENDPACHAYANARRRLQGLEPKGRSALLFGPPGIAYVYLNYGIHWLFNVVTEDEGVAGAVLFRAVEPIEGLAEMTVLRSSSPKIRRISDLANGPGKLTVALGISPDFNGKALTKGPLRLATRDNERAVHVVTSPRIGISQATDLPWRFFEHGNPFVSQFKPSRSTFSSCQI